MEQIAMLGLAGVTASFCTAIYYMGMRITDLFVESSTHLNSLRRVSNAKYKSALERDFVRPEIHEQETEVPKGPKIFPIEVYDGWSVREGDLLPGYRGLLTEVAESMNIYKKLDRVA